jgi:hypothetical protein
MLLPLILIPTLALGQAVTLKRSPKVGDTLQYRATLIFTIYGNDFVYTSTITDKVTEVAKDGSYTVASTQSEIKASAGGDYPVQPGPNQVSHEVFDAHGRVTDMKEDQSSEGWRVAYLSCFILPDKPVAKGDTWTATLPPRADRQTPGASVIYTSEGIDPNPVDGISALKVDEKYAENSQSNKASKTGIVWVNPKDGTVVKVEEQWRNAPIAGITTLVNGNVMYERVMDSSDPVPTLNGGG